MANAKDDHTQAQWPQLVPVLSLASIVMSRSVDHTAVFSRWLKDGWNPFLPQGLSVEETALAMAADGSWLKGPGRKTYDRGWGIVITSPASWRDEWIAKNKELLSTALKAANLPESDLCSYLAYGSMRGSAAGLEVLVEGGATPDMRDSSGCCAMSHTHPSCFGWLAERSKNPEAKDSSGRGVWEVWAEHVVRGHRKAQDLDMVEGFCKRTWKEGSALGVEALGSCRLDVVRRMVEAGAAPSDFGLDTPQGVASALAGLSQRGDALRAFGVVEGICDPAVFSLAIVLPEATGAMSEAGNFALLGRALESLAKQGETKMISSVCQGAFDSKEKRMLLQWRTGDDGPNGKKAYFLAKKAVGLLGVKNQGEIKSVVSSYARAYGFPASSRGRLCDLATWAVEGGFVTDSDWVEELFRGGLKWVGERHPDGSTRDKGAFEGFMALVQRSSLERGLGVKRKKPATGTI